MKHQQQNNLLKMRIHSDLNDIYLPALKDFFENKDRSSECFGKIITMFHKNSLNTILNFYEDPKYKISFNNYVQFSHYIFNNAEKIDIDALKKIYQTILSNPHNNDFNHHYYTYANRAESLTTLVEKKPPADVVKEALLCKQALGIKDNMVNLFRKTIIGYDTKATATSIPNLIKTLEYFFENGLFMSDTYGKKGKYDYSSGDYHDYGDQNLLDFALMGAKTPTKEGIQIKEAVIDFLLNKGVSPNKMVNYESLLEKEKMKVLVNHVLRHNNEFLPKAPFILLAFCQACPEHLNHLMANKPEKMKDFLLGLEGKLNKFEKMFEKNYPLSCLWETNKENIISYIQKAKLKNIILRQEIVKIKKIRKEQRIQGLNQNLQTSAQEASLPGSFKEQLQIALTPKKKRTLL